MRLQTNTQGDRRTTQAGKSMGRRAQHTGADVCFLPFRVQTKKRGDDDHNSMNIYEYEKIRCVGDQNCTVLSSDAETMYGVCCCC